MKAPSLDATEEQPESVPPPRRRRNRSSSAVRRDTATCTLPLSSSPPSSSPLASSPLAYSPSSSTSSLSLSSLSTLAEEPAISSASSLTVSSSATTVSSSTSASTSSRSLATSSSSSISSSSISSSSSSSISSSSSSSISSSSSLPCISSAASPSTPRASHECSSSPAKSPLFRRHPAESTAEDRSSGPHTPMHTVPQYPGRSARSNRRGVELGRERDRRRHAGVAISEDNVCVSSGSGDPQHQQSLLRCSADNTDTDSLGNAELKVPSLSQPAGLVHTVRGTPTPRLDLGHVFRHSSADVAMIETRRRERRRHQAEESHIGAEGVRALRLDSPRAGGRNKCGGSPCDVTLSASLPAAHSSFSVIHQLRHSQTSSPSTSASASASGSEDPFDRYGDDSFEALDLIVGRSQRTQVLGETALLFVDLEPEVIEILLDAVYSEDEDIYDMSTCFVWLLDRGWGLENDNNSRPTSSEQLLGHQLRMLKGELMSRRRESRRATSRFSRAFRTRSRSRSQSMSRGSELVHFSPHPQ